MKFCHCAVRSFINSGVSLMCGKRDMLHVGAQALGDLVQIATLSVMCRTLCQSLLISAHNLDRAPFRGEKYSGC